MNLYDKLKWNRYFYALHTKYKDIKTLKRILCLPFECIRTVFEHKFNIWDYLDEITNNKYIIKISDGSKFFIPRCHRDTIQKTIARDNYYYSGPELDFLRDNYIHDGMTILDIGANIGNHTVYFANQCKAGKVLSFEPQDDIFQILQKNVNLNGLGDRVVLFHNALGEKSATASIASYNENNSGGTSIKLDDEGNIQIIAIDDLDLPKIDFVKIDVEGFEKNVLFGMRKLLRKDKPIIWVEIKEENYQDISSFLSEIGYKLKYTGGENYLFLST